MRIFATATGVAGGIVAAPGEEFASGDATPVGAAAMTEAGGAVFASFMKQKIYPYRYGCQQIMRGEWRWPESV